MTECGDCGPNGNFGNITQVPLGAAIPCWVSIAGRRTSQALGTSGRMSSSVSREQDVVMGKILSLSVPCFSPL